MQVGFEDSDHFPGVPGWLDKGNFACVLLRCHSGVGGMLSEIA